MAHKFTWLLVISIVLLIDHDLSSARPGRASVSRGLTRLSNIRDQGLIRFRQKNAQNKEYFVEIQLGEPAGKFNVRLATEVTDAWLVGQACTTCKSIKTDYPINYYDISKSTSAVDEGKRIEMPDRLVKGFLVKDHLGHLESSGRLDLTEFNFIDIDYAEENLFRDSMGRDGIIGLGRESFSTDRKLNETVNLMKQLAERKLIDKRIFSAYSKLMHEVPNPNQPSTMTPVDGGEVIIGGYDSRLIADGQEIVYAALVDFFEDTYDWTFMVDSVHISSQEFAIANSTKALITSAQPLIGMPEAILDEFRLKYNALFDGSFIRVPNCNRAKMVDITFIVAGKNLTLTPDDYTTKIKDTKDCQLLFANGIGMFHFGHAFMAKFYTIFDAESNRIGFVSMKK